MLPSVSAFSEVAASFPTSADADSSKHWRLAGARDAAGSVRLIIGWTWRDDDGETCTVLLYWTDRGPHGLHAISGALPADQDGHVAVVAIPAGVAVHIHAIITDAKGAMTQVTSGAILITEWSLAAHPAWLRAE